MAELKLLVTTTVFLMTALITPLRSTTLHSPTCRSYCGNLTIDYPFSLQHGCGHPGFRDLLFCINDVLMFHISSGSYRVLDIDYAYRSLSLHDPHLSNCDSIVLGRRGNGFSVEPWRSPYISASPNNVFMLLGCSAVSPLFQGFADRHLPCRNVSGMGCEEYYECPAWDWVGRSKIGSKFGSGPPECCAVSFEAIKAINLTKLQCEGYSSAYALAPLRVDGPHEWAYGIRVTYSVQGGDEFCRACEATGGTCGYSDVDDHKDDGVKQLCMCGASNSTSNCDSGDEILVEVWLMNSETIELHLPSASSLPKFLKELLFESVIRFYKFIKFMKIKSPSYVTVQDDDHAGGSSSNTGTWSPSNVLSGTFLVVDLEFCQLHLVSVILETLEDRSNPE